MNYREAESFYGAWRNSRPDLFSAKERKKRTSVLYRRYPRNEDQLALLLLFCCCGIVVKFRKNYRTYGGEKRNDSIRDGWLEIIEDSGRWANHNISKLVVIISRPEKLRISYISFFLITHPVNLFLYKFASSERTAMFPARYAVGNFYNDGNFSPFLGSSVGEGRTRSNRFQIALFSSKASVRSFRSFPCFLNGNGVSSKRLLRENFNVYDTRFLPSIFKIANRKRSNLTHDRNITTQ